MKVLVLGKTPSPIIPCIEKSCDLVIDGKDGKLLLADDGFRRYDYIISYGYRHIIQPDIVNRMRRRIINLHISLLPWNRGADPNLWSWLEDTPKGVTIHFIDEGIDTGDIIVQKKVSFTEDETLATSYQKLSTEIETLFADWWPFISANNVRPKKQEGINTVHKSQDKEQYSYLLTKGWSTPVKQLIGKGIR